MSGKHTRGLLSHQDKRPQCGGFSLFAGDQFIAFVSDSDECTDWQANAERMVACWNACQGIDTADLDVGSVSIIHKLHDEVAKLVLAQRDELLAALNLLKATDFGSNVKTADDERHMDKVAAFARAAIAKVEGGA